MDPRTRPWRSGANKVTFLGTFLVSLVDSLGSLKAGKLRRLGILGLVSLQSRQAGNAKQESSGTQLIQLFGTWKGQPHLRTRSMARLWSYVVKSCCMERKKTWIESKVEAAWTSGQRHRPRSLSSHRVDSHASTVDIHGIWGRSKGGLLVRELFA